LQSFDVTSYTWEQFPQLNIGQKKFHGIWGRSNKRN
jgi:hypothetical protein